MGDGFLCGRYKRAWKRSSPLRVTRLLGKFANQDRTSRPSAKVTLQYGWYIHLVAQTRVWCKCTNGRYARCGVSHPVLVLDLSVG